MRLFGRRLSRYLVAAHLPAFGIACVRALWVFESPLMVIWSYLTRRPPAERLIRLRNGYVIYLSEDPADIVTVFLIYAREDYGSVAPGTVVVDIGANIGIFALFAASGGARKVYAYEPNTESFALLEKNIVANGLGQTVHAEKLAVVGRPSPPVRFPRASNVMNAMVSESSEVGDYDVVPTVTFKAIVTPLGAIDLLKMDCEGAEYDILLHSSADDLRNAAEIRLEYHKGPKELLVATFQRSGFGTRQFMDEGEGGGYLWLTREPRA